MLYIHDLQTKSSRITKKNILATSNPHRFFFVHRPTHELNRCFSECPAESIPSRRLERSGICVPTTTCLKRFEARPTPALTPPHSKAYRERGRRCGGRPVADGRGDGGGQHAHVHHHQLQLLRPHRRRRPSTIHARWPRSVRPSVLPSERQRSIWICASASCDRPTDVPEPLVSDAVTSNASRVHTLNRVIASYCASLPLRRRPLRRRRKESAPASGPDASKSGRARARYR